MYVMSAHQTSFTVLMLRPEKQVQEQLVTQPTPSSCGPGLRVDGGDAHLQQQAPDAFTVHALAVQRQWVEPGRAFEGADQFAEDRWVGRRPNPVRAYAKERNHATLSTT